MRHGMAVSMLGALGFALAAGSVRAEVIEIKIDNLTFAPRQIAAHVGDTIQWVNADFVAHTATARNGNWDLMLPPHTAKTLVLKAEGQVDFYCKFHPNMTGRMTVAK